MLATSSVLILEPVAGTASGVIKAYYADIINNNKKPLKWRMKQRQEMNKVTLQTVSKSIFAAPTDTDKARTNANILSPTFIIMEAVIGQDETCSFLCLNSASFFGILLLPYIFHYFFLTELFMYKSICKY